MENIPYTYKENIDPKTISQFRNQFPSAHNASGKNMDDNTQHPEDDFEDPIEESQYRPCGFR